MDLGLRWVAEFHECIIVGNVLLWNFQLALGNPDAVGIEKGQENLYVGQF